MKNFKRVLSLLLSLMLVLGAVAVGGMSVSALPNDHISWDDTGSCYEISTYSELKEFAAIVNGTHADIAQNTAACAILIDDIDASASAEDNDWTPIGNSDNPYIGTFDGNGYKITGLTFNNPSAYYVGLFGYVGGGGKVQNVGLEGGSITGAYNVGGVAGYNSGTVTNCYNTGDVSGNDYVGGVIGENYGGTVTNCYNTDSVTATGSNVYVGSVIGENYGGTVTNCYNTGDVTGRGYVGGVVGYNYGGTVTNCYNTGSVTAQVSNACVGGVVGDNYGTVRYCYYDKSVCGEIGAVDGADDNTNNVTGLTTEQMTAGAYTEGTVTNMPGFSSEYWIVKPSDEFYSYYPHLKGFNFDKNGSQILAEDIRMTDWPARLLKEDAREISDYNELKAFTQEVNNNNTNLKGVLLKDIDASASAEANDWTPIGNDEKKYTGTFDGGGHIITGLTFNNTSAYYVGLFGYVGEGGKVQNVGLEGGSITGKNYVGGVVGENYGGTVTNCYNTGDVTGSDFVGGVVGYNYGETVTNCYNTGSVTATEDDAFVGGVAGYNYDSSSVENCYNTGSVTATGNYAYAGGVVGYNYNSSSVENCYNTGSVTVPGSNARVGGVVGYNYSSCSVENCYNTGSVTAQGNNARVGGVAGDNYGTFTNCYNTGSVTATADYADAGGVVGNDYYGTVTNCYNTGSVTAPGTGVRVGGVVGINSDTVTNCYNTGNVTGNEYVGGVAGSNVNNGKITNCYNTGSVTAQGNYARVGGVAGYNRGTVRYCYYDKSLCGEIGAFDGADDDTNNVTGLSTEQMTGESALENMTGFGSDNWLTKADEKDESSGKYCWFCPHLKGFNFNDDLTQMTGDEIEAADWPAKAEVTVTWDNDSFTYDGEAHSPQARFEINSVQKYCNEYTVYDESGNKLDKAVNAGTYIAEIKGHSNTKEQFTITPKSITGATVTLSSESAEYTGSEFTPEVTVKDGEKTLEKGTDYTVSYNNNVNASENAKVIVKGIGNYTGGAEKAFTITPASVTLTADSAEETYDGTEKTVSGFTSSVSGLTFDGVSASGNGTLAGSYDVTFSGVTVNETKDTSGNYVVTQTVNGTLTINPVTDEVTVTITGKTDTADYDGEEKSVSGYDVEISNPLYTESDFTFSGTAEAKLTEPGTENMGLDESQFSNNSSDFANVKFVIAEDGKLTVNPVITFVNEDGTELQSGAVAYGETPDYNGETPVKTENDGYAYEFAAWTPEITEATENATYTATYTQTANKYTATFIADGETVDTVTFTVEDSTITEPAVPEKEGNTGEWESYTLGAEDITVNAVYTVNEYTVTYIVDGNETQVTYKYGAAVEKPADPVKDGYTFTGWDNEIPETMPAENLTITAEFEAVPEPVEPTPTEPTPTEPTPTEPTPTDTEPAHEHDYKGEVTTKPTCTEDGVMTYTCECGESYTKAIPKTGHKPGEWTVVTPATTEAAGKEVRKCTVCGEVLAEREIAKLEPEETDAGIVGVNLEKTNAYGIANAFGVDPGKLPAGSTVTWYVNGEKAGEGNGFRVDNPTENYTIKAVVTNRDGKVIGETEEVTVKVNNSFFARLYYWLCRIIQKVIDLFKGK